MAQQLTNFIIPLTSAIIALLGYEYIVKKDKKEETIKFTKDMTILITKMDMLITQNSGLSERVSAHDMLIHEHSIKIAVLEDTQSFRRIKEND